MSSIAARSRIRWHPVNSAVLDTRLLFYVSSRNGGGMSFFGRKVRVDGNRYAVIDETNRQDDIRYEGSDVYPSHWAPVPENPGPHNVSPKPHGHEFEPGFKRRLDWGVDKRDGIC